MKTTEFTYICARCGAITDLDTNLDDGTTLTCTYCGQQTIMLLLTPEEYVMICNLRIDRLSD